MNALNNIIQLNSVNLRKLFFFLPALLISFFSYAQTYELLRTPIGIDTLFVDKSKILVNVDSIYHFGYVKDLIDNSQYFDSLHLNDALDNDTTTHKYKLRLKSGITNSKYLNAILFLNDTLHFVLKNYRFFNDGHFSETGILIVSLEFLSDTSSLISECSAYGHTFLGVRTVGLQFLGLVETNETEQTFDFAEYLHSTNDYLFTEPNLGYWNAQTFTPQDWHYNKSWHLKNTGSNNPKNYTGTIGADINAEEAWDNIYQGSCSSIKVAIIDDGVLATHPDIQSFGYGYNALKHDPYYSSPGYGYTRPIYYQNNGMPEKTSAHGTPCAGIACGKGDNGIGITGVAFNSLVFGIKSIHQGFGTTISHAYGYYLAIDSVDADIISGSFAIFSNRIGNYNSFLINSAIDYAVQNGRSGLGTPVFHSTGNGNFNGCLPGIETIGYPANYSPTIAVTGTDVCDNLKGDGDCTNQCAAPANFGIGTDIAAPYNDIWTTDNSGSRGFTDSNYTIFGGTSASCPMAAGTMALIYSANPFLTLNQSRYVLESSTDKVGGYTYNSSVSGQPNGTWSEELGYGRINAGTSVINAINTKIKLKAMNVPGEIPLDGNVVFKNNFITYPILDVRFNDNNEAYGNFNVTWYKNGKLFYTSTTNQVSISSPGRYYALIENNCNNKTLLKTETIDIRADCTGGLGYNLSMLTGANISVPTVMSTVSSYEYVPVEGDIIISTGGSLTVSNRVFILGSCAKIKVQSGGSFIASNCKFIGCDDWQGIICDGSASSITFSNCQIQDATAGIISKNGGNLSITNTEFAYNYLHFGAEDGLISTTISFDANYFLELKDLGAVDNVECSNSYYSNLNFGQYQPQIFLEDMLSGSFDDNIYIINNSYLDDNISSFNIQNCSHISVYNNSIKGKYKTSFTALNTDDIEISTNEFENIREGAIDEITQDGIFLEDVEDAEINENEIKKFRYGLQFIQNISGAINTYLETNKFRENHVGLVYASEENPIGAGLGSANLPCSTKNEIRIIIQCNLFTGNNYGVVGSGPLKSQGIGNNSAGNRFTLNNAPLNEESSFIGYNCGSPINYKYAGWINGKDDDPLSNNNSALTDVDGITLHNTSNNDINKTNTGISGVSCTNILYFTSMNDQIDTISNHIDIFPNPFTSQVTIYCPKENSKISIFNIHGKLIYSSTNNSNIINIDFDSLSSGLYMLSIEHGGIIDIYKIIKANP